MTPRENFHRMMQGQGPELLPLDIWVTGPALDLIERHTGTRDWVKALGVSFRGLYANYPLDEEAWRQAYAAVGLHVPAEAHIGSFGHAFLKPPPETLGEAYHLTEMIHPLSEVKTVDQLERLPWPAFGRDTYAHFPEAVRAGHEEGLAVIGHMACTVFEHSWYARGMDQLFFDLMEGNPVGTWLLDYFTKRSVHAVRAFAQVGVDLLMLGDDVGSQRGMIMSLDMWREHLKPRLAQVVRAAREAATGPLWIAFHSDGAVGEIVDDLVEIGVDLLNPVQPECLDVDAIVREHRHHVGFYGMVGTQTTMPFGTPEEVREVVRRVAGYARDGVKVILAPTHVLEPDVPWENMSALVDEHRKQRLLA